jgi:mxaJ protein
MCSLFRSVVLSLALAAFFATPAAALKVCADPNNLPFSSREQTGFENHIIRIIAAELGEGIEYVWWPQRRGFIRSTLAAGQCDVIPGVASNLEIVRTSAPYYRSAYVFVTRQDRELTIGSFDDPKLRALTIGVQIIGDDGWNSPPAHALSRRGIINNLRGFTVNGDYSKPHPSSAIIDAVAKGTIDVAIAWGPLAGYFAKLSPVPLSIATVRPLIDGPMLPMMFDISMGVRREDHRLRNRLDAALARRRHEINNVLTDFFVPRLDRGSVENIEP